MFTALKRLFSKKERDPAAEEARVEEEFAKVRQETPVPVFWLFGKTQSGKTTLVKYLTGADDAEVGQGFRPTTRFSREYDFPSPEAPLITFLDTRGVDEPGYDPGEDLARFDATAHVVVVTVKATDHAVERMVEHLRRIRESRHERPILLMPTCLHEAYPQRQHSQPYPFVGPPGELPPEADVPEELRATLDEQRRRFEGLYDWFVPVDITPPEEGFEDPHYGGERLKAALVEALPQAYRRALLTLDEATSNLEDVTTRQALPYILSYSGLAATAGAIPIPWVDLLILPGIQTRMIYHLGRLYGQPVSAEHFLQMAGALGMGLLVRQAIREVTKFIPFFGSVAGAALAGTATFALGKAFCFYYSNVLKGRVPTPEELKAYYQEQLAQAERLWRKSEKQ
jgi:uncharacterized protein (DUF697 family)